MFVSEATAVEFSAPPVDQVLDLHGDPAHHDLALFMHGNQWMAMDALLEAFRTAAPQVQRIYYETLPPQVLVQQLHQGALRMGELEVRVAPDVLTAGIEAVRKLVDEGLANSFCEYASNRLAILVRRGNPLGIAGWADLVRPGVRVALPDPQTEGIGRLVREALTASAGPEAWTELSERRRGQGTVLFTRIHHRETPLHLREGRVDAGPVWLTEARYQERLDVPLETVHLAPRENRRGRYAAAVLERTGAHPEAARTFVDFLCGAQGQAILAGYGFEGPVGD